MRKQDMKLDDLHDEDGPIFGAAQGLRWGLPLTLVVWAVIGLLFLLFSHKAFADGWARYDMSIFAVSNNKGGGSIVLLAGKSESCSDRGQQEFRGYSTHYDQSVDYFCWMINGSLVLASYDNGRQYAYSMNFFTLNANIRDALKARGQWQ